jgi:hypothetical protein
MTAWNAVFQVEQVEKLTLIPHLPTHHRANPPSKRIPTESQFVNDRDAFFNGIGQVKSSSPKKMQVCYHQQRSFP